MAEDDLPEAVNHPSHYTSHPSGVECIDITEHMSFLRGNAMKYLWRAGQKGEDIAKTIEDLQKARWYLDREITNLEDDRDRMRVEVPATPDTIEEFFTNSLTDEERAERAEREEPAPMVDAQPAKCSCAARWGQPNSPHDPWCPAAGGPGRGAGG